MVGDIRGCVSDVPGAEQRVVPQTGGQEHWGVLLINLITPVSAALSNTKYHSPDSRLQCRWAATLRSS